MDAQTYRPEERPAAARSLDELRASLPDYARDLKLNLASVLTSEGAPGLTAQQIWALALAAAIAARQLSLARALQTAAGAHLDAAHVTAARTAAAIMAMNNIYYRFVHLVGHADYQGLPARLRMNAIANPGVDRRDFELLSLAVSAINGCGACVAAHERQLRDQGMDPESIQSAVRIAAVVHAVAVVLDEATHREAAASSI